MSLRGRYILTFKDQEPIVLENTIVLEGAEQFFAELLNGAATAPLHIGLCNQVPNKSDTLGDITTEPTIGVNGYARVPLLRNTTDWPLIASANDETAATSKVITFTASGGAFDAPYSRLFMCNALTGFVGLLFSFSAALPLPVTQADGTSFNVQYQLYLA